MTTSDNEWYNEWQRMTTSDNEWYNEWQRVAGSDNKWQLVTVSDSSGTTNKIGTVHFKKWIISILSMTKIRYTTTSRDGSLQLEWLNKDFP